MEYGKTINREIKRKTNLCGEKNQNKEGIGKRLCINDWNRRSTEVFAFYGIEL